MTDLTRAEWTARVLRILSDLNGAPTPHLLGITRSLPAVSVVYLEDSSQVMLDEVASCLCADMPPFALVGFCVSSMTHYPLADTAPQATQLMLVASLDDTDSVLVACVDGEWRLFETVIEGDAWSLMRIRLWDLLAESHFGRKS